MARQENIHMIKERRAHAKEKKASEFSMSFPKEFKPKTKKDSIINFFGSKRKVQGSRFLSE